MRPPRVPVVTLVALAEQAYAERAAAETDHMPAAARLYGLPLEEHITGQRDPDPYLGARMVEFRDKSVWMTPGQQRLAAQMMNLRQEDGTASLVNGHGRF